MGVMASDKGGGTPIEPGVYPAICVGVYDIGTQDGGQYGPKHQVIISFELPDERMAFERDGQQREGPRMISKFYTLSLNERANLRRELEAWRGRPFSAAELEGFDLIKLLGVNCMLGIIINKNNKNKINSINPAREKRTSENEPQYFSFEDRTPLPDGPEWLVKIITSAKEYGRDDDMPPIDEYDDYSPPPGDDEIPF